MGSLDGKRPLILSTESDGLNGLATAFAIGPRRISDPWYELDISAGEEGVHSARSSSTRTVWLLNSSGGCMGKSRIGASIPAQLQDGPVTDR